MDISLYFQILDIGIQYEKVRKRGTRWRGGEKKFLKEEVMFWLQILDYIDCESKEIDCSMQLFEMLQGLCDKYRFPNYEKVLMQKDALIKEKIIFKRNVIQEINARNFMKRVFEDMLQLLTCHNGKDEFYKLLIVIHNIPKDMHGENVLCKHMNHITYDDALKYVNDNASFSMRERYTEFLGLL